MIVKITRDQLIFDANIQTLCKQAFKGHPSGCPSYGKKKTCPPHTSLIDELFDLDKDVFVVYVEFALGMFAQEALREHPDWSVEQAYDRFFWEPAAKKELQAQIQVFTSRHPGYFVTDCPESYGVNVVELMKSLGVTLRWDWSNNHRLTNKAYLVALAGIQKNSS